MAPKQEINEEVALKFVRAMVDGLRANGLNISVNEATPEVLAHSEDTEGADLPGCGIHIIIN